MKTKHIITLLTFSFCYLLVMSLSYFKILLRLCFFRDPSFLIVKVTHLILPKTTGRFQQRLPTDRSRAVQCEIRCLLPPALSGELRAQSSEKRAAAPVSRCCRIAHKGNPAR